MFRYVGLKRGRRSRLLYSRSGPKPAISRSPTLGSCRATQSKLPHITKLVLWQLKRNFLGKDVNYEGRMHRATDGGLVAEQSGEHGSYCFCSLIEVEHNDILTGPYAA